MPDENPNEVATPTHPPAVQPEAYSGLRILKSWTRDLFFSLAFALLIILFVYQPVKVEGSSMEPGLEDQERIFINKLVYRIETIERGDVIVFRYPRDHRKSFIKRVIGIPGDRVRVIEGRVYLNGELLPEPYVSQEYFDNRSYEERLVKPDTYYVMGDHRSMSNDSRDFGLVPRGNIYGKAVFGYWPMEKLGTVH